MAQSFPRRCGSECVMSAKISPPTHIFGSAPDVHCDQVYGDGKISHFTSVHVYLIRTVDYTRPPADPEHSDLIFISLSSPNPIDSCIVHVLCITITEVSIHGEKVEGCCLFCIYGIKCFSCFQPFLCTVKIILDRVREVKIGDMSKRFITIGGSRGGAPGARPPICLAS